MKYFKNKYVEVDYDAKKRIATIKASNINIIGAKDKEYTEIQIKSNKSILAISEIPITFIKISSNRFYNFYFDKSEITVHVHDVEDIVISKFGVIIE